MNDVGVIAQAGLLQDSRAVRTDGLDAELQLARDIADRLARPEQTKDLQLTRRQPFMRLPAACRSDDSATISVRPRRMMA